MPIDSIALVPSVDETTITKASGSIAIKADGVTTDKILDGTITSADLASDAVNNFIDLVYVDGVTAMTSILAHSATAWTAINGTSTVITADAGVTWANASADIADMTGVSRVSKVNKALAICCDHDSSNISVTADSGDNWASATTDVAGTRVLCLSFPTALVAVAGMDEGTTRDIYFSGDAGDTWTVSSASTTNDVRAIDMLNGTAGIAIDNAGNIYTTSDSGDNWTDSNQNVVSITTPSDIIALTASTGVKLSLDPNTIETFTTGAGGTVRLNIADAGGGNNYISNLIKITNGNLYFVNYNFNNADSTSADMTLYKSSDSGVTWAQRALGSNLLSGIASLNTNITKSQIVEYDTDKLLILVGDDMLMKIDES